MKNTGDRGSRAGEKQSSSEMSVTVHAPEALEGDESFLCRGAGICAQISLIQAPVCFSLHHTTSSWLQQERREGREKQWGQFSWRTEDNRQIPLRANLVCQLG